MKKVFSLLLMSVPFLVSAQGFQVNLQGQKQQGMGGAGSAFMQDGAAVFYNPGGVSFLKQNSIDASANAVFIKGTFVNSADNKEDKTESPVVPPFSAYGVFGNPTKKIRYGFGIYTPFGSDMKWENGWAGRYAITRLSLQTIFAQPTVSYKICDKLGIGAGLVLATGSLKLEKDIAFGPAGTGHSELKGTPKLGFGFNAGVYFKATDKLSMSLTHRSSVKMDVENQDVTFSGIPHIQAAPGVYYDTHILTSGEYSTELTLPSTTTLGFAYAPNKKLTLALDVNYIGWKSYDSLNFDFKNPLTPDSKNKRDYKNTWAFRAGGQYQFDQKWTGRAGLSYGLTPIKDGYVSPEVPDSDRLNFTAGIGYKINKHFKVDASFTYENMKRTGTNALSEAKAEAKVSGKYDVKLFIPGIGVSYVF